MFPLCPCSHCNNGLLTHMLWAHSIQQAALQCQRSLYTTRWHIEDQCEHSLEMRAPILIQTETKLLLSALPDRGGYCGFFQQCKHFTLSKRKKCVPCCGLYVVKKIHTEILIAKRCNNLLKMFKNIFSKLESIVWLDEHLKLFNFLRRRPWNWIGNAASQVEVWLEQKCVI